MDIMRVGSWRHFEGVVFSFAERRFVDIDESAKIQRLIILKFTKSIVCGIVP